MAYKSTRQALLCIGELPPPRGLALEALGFNLNHRMRLKVSPATEAASFWRQLRQPARPGNNNTI